MVSEYTNGVERGIEMAIDALDARIADTDIKNQTWLSALAVLRIMQSEYNPTPPSV